MILLYLYTALIIGFDRAEYAVSEASGNVTLTILVRGVTTHCREQEWMVQLITHNIAAIGERQIQ